MKRLALLLAAGLALLPTRVGSETLNASRLIFRVTADSFVLVSRTLPQPLLVTYCGDGDGCKLSLKIENGYGLEVKSTRLYLGEVDPLLWHSEASQVAGAHRDDDDNTESALSLWSGFSSCGLADNEVGAADEGPGFTFALLGSNGLVVTCVLVVED